ncbi:MAG: MFS transporter [Pyrinomonadaceae bacterium]
MDFSLIALAGTVGAGLLLLLLAWRAVRFMMRLALIGVLVLLCLPGPFFGGKAAPTGRNPGVRRPPLPVRGALVIDEYSTNSVKTIDREESYAPRARLWQRYRRLPRNVVAIGLVSLLNDVSSEIVYPLLPFFLALTLGSSPAAIGLIEGAAESVASLLKLFSGYASDRLGKRKGLVVFGYTLAAATRPLLALTTSWPQVLGLRLTDRVGKGLRSAPRDAMLADSTLAQERGIAFGFHRAMDHAGAVIGPLIGLLILYVVAENREAPAASDYRTIFLIAAIPGLAAVLVAAFAVGERTGQIEGAASVIASPPQLSLRGFDRNFKKYLAVIALFTLSSSSDAFLLLRAQTAGVSVAIIPLLWAALHVSRVLSSLIGGDLSDRLGRKALIVSGWLLYAGVYAGFAFVQTPGQAWVLFLIYGIYSGLAEGAEKALVVDLVPAPQQRGSAFGLYNLAFGITVLPASLLMGAIWNWRGPRLAFLVNAAIGTTAALLMLFTVKTDRRELA